MAVITEWVNLWLTSIYMLHMDRLTLGFVC
jgi:hypothetical protein